MKHLFFNFVIDFLLYLIKINNFLRHKKKEELQRKNKENGTYGPVFCSATSNTVGNFHYENGRCSRIVQTEANTKRHGKTTTNKPERYPKPFDCSETSNHGNSKPTGPERNILHGDMPSHA
jgi:hypothetical protein